MEVKKIELYEKSLSDGTEDYFIAIQRQNQGSWFGSTEMPDVNYNHSLKTITSG